MSEEEILSHGPTSDESIAASFYRVGGPGGSNTTIGSKMLSVVSDSSGEHEAAHRGTSQESSMMSAPSFAENRVSGEIGGILPTTSQLLSAEAEPVDELKGRLVV